MKVGDRVRLSAHGLKAFRQIARTMPDREGTVIRITFDGVPVVQWDGRATPDGGGTHQRFLKVIKNGADVSVCPPKDGPAPRPGQESQRPPGRVA